MGILPMSRVWPFFGTKGAPIHQPSPPGWVMFAGEASGLYWPGFLIPDILFVVGDIVAIKKAAVFLLTTRARDSSC